MQCCTQVYIEHSAAPGPDREPASRIHAMQDLAFSWARCSAGARNRAPGPDTERWCPTRRAPGRDAHSAGARHTERRGPTHRTPGPDTERRGPTQSARSRHSVSGPDARRRASQQSISSNIISSSTALSSALLNNCIAMQCWRHTRHAPLKFCLKMLVACHVRSNQLEIWQCAIRNKQSLQVFSPCISARIVWGLCGVCVGIKGFFMLYFIRL